MISKNTFKLTVQLPVKWTEIFFSLLIINFLSSCSMPGESKNTQLLNKVTGGVRSELEPTPDPNASPTPTPTNQPTNQATPTSTPNSSGGKAPPNRTSNYGSMDPGGYDGIGTPKEEVPIRVIFFKSGSSSFVTQSEAESKAQEYLIRLNNAVTVDGYRYLKFKFLNPNVVAEIIDDPAEYIGTVNSINTIRSKYGVTNAITVAINHSFSGGLFGVASGIFETLSTRPTFVMGNDYYILGYVGTLAHEIGHVLGGSHTAATGIGSGQYNWCDYVPEVSGICPVTTYYTRPGQAINPYVSTVNGQKWGIAYNLEWFTGVPFSEELLNFWTEGYDVAYSKILALYHKQFKN
ncbi:MAG: hypothetical protein QE271_01335 [Bacteriovoracaceae bacterium]|nr:hypothetical protein [Bacteriovoracaceae bacterium]